eukprot:TRINITY_DN4708_c0_g1_i1.p1 TRINITY_DN4708_c0_g1~~TRINITY_DN4708_c0_g1_i1.p1  ORF type:complete len:506 (+),score=50.07 TRINITY_DN4708_c0_g1_i1:22-1518(+)
MEEGEARTDPFQLRPHSPEKFHYLALFDMQHWYGPLARWTMSTRLVPITIPQAQALVWAFERQRRDMDSTLETTHDEEQNQLLLQLQALLEPCMLELGSREQGVFVRLSTQSAKDVGRDKASEYVVRQEYQKLGYAPDYNSQAIALLNAAGSVMRVHTSEEAVALLTSSDRINRSLLHALAQTTDGESELPWDMQIIIRSWVPGLTIGHEFRVFVCGGQVRAISQYNEWCYYEELLGREASIVNRIMNSFHSLSDSVPAAYTRTGYIIDFGLLGMEATDDVVMVEINPFGPVTGAALFDWNTDRTILTGGYEPWRNSDQPKGSEYNLPSHPLGELSASISQTVWTPIHSGEHHYHQLTTNNEIGPIDHQHPIYLRLLSAPNPLVDYQFVSSFNIHIYLTEEDSDSDDQDTSDEYDEDVEKFVDMFITPNRMQSAVDAACGGRYVKTYIDKVATYVVASLKEDEECNAERKKAGLEWRQVERSLENSAKSWFRYKIATL